MNESLVEPIQAIRDIVCTLGDRMGKMEEGLLGTLDKPGLLHLVRRTDDTVTFLKSDVSSLRVKMEGIETSKEVIVGLKTEIVILKSQTEALYNKVEDLQLSKTRLIGVGIGICLASGTAGAAFLKVASGGIGH